MPPAHSNTVGSVIHCWSVRRKRNAANPDQPPPVLEPTLGVADLSG